MKSIVCDIDGVIAQYDLPALTKKYFGIAVPERLVWCYSIEDALGVSKAEVEHMFRKEVNAKPNLVPGAIQALQWFVSKDYNIYILSHRAQFSTGEEVESWLEKYDIPFSSVINWAGLPSYVHAHIDDNPRKLMDVREKVTVKHSILFVRPWNKKCLDINRVLERANNWKEVKEIVNGK